jgi:hypothetical protein
MSKQKPDPKLNTKIIKKAYVKPKIKVVTIETSPVFAPSVCGGY